MMEKVLLVCCPSCLSVPSRGSKQPKYQIVKTQNIIVMKMIFFVMKNALYKLIFLKNGTKNNKRYRFKVSWRILLFSPLVTFVAFFAFVALVALVTISPFANSKVLIN